ncbi:Nnf1-domain-containing protein [Delphinella strobiligena]|nr:Nnf1-domain-containing protein [Delphinella strobiligena]
MPATTSRSPSPATAPPIAAAPGPRASALQKLYADAIAHTVKTCNYNNFAECFPTPAKHTPEAMKELHSDFIQKLHHSCKENFHVVLRDRDVVASLNDLDRLVEDARRRRAKAQEAAAGQPVQHPVPPHTLPASALCHAHLAPSLIEQKTIFDTRLQNVQSENVHLLQTIVQQRREIEGLVSGLETVIADIDASNHALAPEDMTSLTDDAVLLDSHLRTDG